MTSETQKQVILSMYRDGYPYTKIADCLLLSPNTIKSICYRSGIKPSKRRQADPNVCRNCGQPLKQVKGGRQKVFCCDKCRYAWWNRKRAQKPYRLVCHQCGGRFVSYGNKKRKFCSRRCCLINRYGKDEGVP